MGSSGYEDSRSRIKDLKMDDIPKKDVKNKEIYLIELYTKKKKITEEHLINEQKPTEEDNLIMARLDIEISEYMEIVFEHKKDKKHKKIFIDDSLPTYKYSKLKKKIEKLNSEWEELNGKNEEYKKYQNEKSEMVKMYKNRGLCRLDPYLLQDEERKAKLNEMNYEEK